MAGLDNSFGCWITVNWARLFDRVSRFTCK
jgi:hypothetical protein